MRAECSPPLGEDPSCFTEDGGHMVSSEACAREYAFAFGIGDVTPLVTIANSINVVHTLCTQVQSEVRHPHRSLRSRLDAQNMRVLLVCV